MVYRVPSSATWASPAALTASAVASAMWTSGMLTAAGVVVVERRGRERVNHLNPVPLREWYERWVQPMADAGAASLLALKRAAETGESVMSEPVDQIRTVRLAFELRIEASAQRTFEVMTQRSLDWFPVTYGEDRVRRVVLEPRVGGQHYEDWGDGRGHLYGEVTVYDPPLRWATRGRIMPGTILDTDYRLREEADAVVVSVTKVATGPMTQAEAAGIARFGDLTGYAPAIQKLAAS